ncbi:MAG: 2,3-bisphosphoglycerate-independent phosphoglycerate mutase [Nitrospirae bacterium]|nr:2,3-bisphosphoglycerate-independent phosphoglycerate mutase [Nitrospirota bacterium]
MRPVVLIVLDGWGISNNPDSDAQAKARIPFYKNLLNEYPHTALECSGESVGLPNDTMGNSEVGHLNLGAGRIVYQDYTRINKAIREGLIKDNEALNRAVKAALDNNSAIHLLGLLSDAGVHSHISHLFGLVELAARQGVKKIFIHAFTDGRDTPPSSGINYIKSAEAFLQKYPQAKIATVTGRYWAMDRDKRWNRVEHAYNALVLGEGVNASSAAAAVEQSYMKSETDEFIKPTVIHDGAGAIGKISGGDSVVFFNFRADRARELTRALTDDSFKEFKRELVPKLSSFVTMTMYDENLPLPAAFPPLRLTNILGEVLSTKGLKQLRIAETEKYAHVTYFFNGGEEMPFKGEGRVLIPSPKDVPTYDLKPEMSANEVTDEVLKRLDGNNYDFILINFANPDMVGHTGIMEAAIKACETIDKCLSRIVEKASSLGRIVIITSDHGNCEQMLDGDSPHTAHTLNKVPFILLKKGAALREGGILADVAPTILDLMGIQKPEEMTGESLLLNA